MMYVVAVLAVAATVGVSAYASAEPYQILTNSPVHVTGAGNESVLVYGEAPGAQRVEITIHDHTHGGVVRDGRFHLVVPVPPPGAYGVHGVWHHTAMEPSAGGMAETATVGHLAVGLLTVLGYGYGDEPAHTVVVRQGAHDEGCAGCVDHPSGAVEAGGYVLVSNADTEGHRFVTESLRTVHSTGHLDPGESVRLPFNSGGEYMYRCAYHPWLGFAVAATGMYEPVHAGSALVLETPGFAGESVRVGIYHTGGADTAHVVFVQGGRVLEAGMAPLADGRGVYTADAREWRVGEVVVSVSAGVDHAAGTVSVRPPPGAAERAGYITGYEGMNGILINGGLARPAGIITLDAAADATRQVCGTGREALFRGDPGLASRGSHHSEGTVWCDGVNLGVYLLESGLAMADPVRCSMAQAEWLVPYCRHGAGFSDAAGSPDAEPPDGAGPTLTISDDLPEGAELPDGPSEGGEPPDVAEPPDAAEPPDDAEFPVIVLEDLPPIPEGVAEPDVPVCDHHADPACPCPEGWVRNGEWCDPDWQDAADAAGEAGETVGEAAGEIREEAVHMLGGFFEWAYNGMAAIGDFVVDFSRGLVGDWGT